MEPIIAGKPVVFGPHMENFAMLAKTLVSNNGAVQVSDSESLERAVSELLHDGDGRKCLVQNAHTALSEHQGATSRASTLVHELVSRN